MTDTAWRDAARALRTGQIPPQAFVAALGEDRGSKKVYRHIDVVDMGNVPCDCMELV